MAEHMETETSCETITVDGGQVTTITLDLPETVNALSPGLCKEVIDVPDSLNDGTRVVVLTGAGETFYSGGDIGDMDEHDDGRTAGDLCEFIDYNGHAVIRALHDLDQPVIALVGGHAVGAGFNLALACDLIIAEETARFGQVFRNVGLHPDCGGTRPQQVGLKKACELIFTGKMIDAREAEELGLLNQIAPDSELNEATTELAETIAAGPPITIELKKESTYENADAPLDEALDRETLAQLFCLKTEDFAEGVAAYTDERRPEFTGK